MKLLFILILLYLTLPNVSGKCADNKTEVFYKHKDDYMYVYGNTSKNCHSPPIKIDLSNFNRAWGAPCVNRFLIWKVCIESGSVCHIDEGGHERGLLLCYSPNLRPTVGSREALVPEQYQLPNIPGRELGCGAESKDIRGDKYQHGILFQHDGKRFIIKTTFDANTYFVPADNTNEEKCFIMELGSEGGIVTKITGADGKSIIDCGKSPDSNLTRHFDNRKNAIGKKLWQLFMDLAPVFATSTYIGVRGGGPTCKLYIRMEGGSFANCKTELIPAIACVNVNAKNLGCTPTMEITKQETKTIEETHNAGETTTISRLRGTRNSFEGNHVNGFTKIDSHKFGGTIGLPTGSVSLFGLVTASGPKFEFRYDYTKETQQNYQYSATTVEEEQFQHTEGNERSSFYQRATSKSWTTIWSTGVTLPYREIPPCHQLVVQQKIWYCGTERNYPITLIATAEPVSEDYGNCTTVGDIGKPNITYPKAQPNQPVEGEGG